MKVKRQDISESYSTTVGWVKDFERSIHKDGNFLEALRSRYDKQNVFSSIEEKMSDLKERVGFDLITRPNADPANGIISTGGCGEESAGGEECGVCSSGNECPCDDGEDSKESGHEFSEEHIAMAEKVLSYIRDAAQSSRNLPGKEIVNKAMDNLGSRLSGDDVGLNIDKLIEFTNDLINAESDRCDSSMEYIDYEPSGSEDSNDVADYYDHASSS
jgi:hypothetical protein